MPDPLYSLEYINSPEYTKLSEMFFSLAKDDDIKEKMRMVLYEGKLGPSHTSGNLHLKNSYFLEAQNRAGYAYILATHPETFDIIVNNNINLFHGTSSLSLPHILEYGMQSVDMQVARGSYPEGGEAWSRQAGTRDFISFTDSLDISMDYVEMNLQNLSNRPQVFGVLFGIDSRRIILSSKMCC